MCNLMDNVRNGDQPYEATYATVTSMASPAERYRVASIVIVLQQRSTGLVFWLEWVRRKSVNGAEHGDLGGDIGPFPTNWQHATGRERNRGSAITRYEKAKQ